MTTAAVAIYLAGMLLLGPRVGLSLAKWAVRTETTRWERTQFIRYFWAGLLCWPVCLLPVLVRWALLRANVNDRIIAAGRANSVWKLVAPRDKVPGG